MAMHLWIPFRCSTSVLAPSVASVAGTSPSRLVDIKNELANIDEIRVGEAECKPDLSRLNFLGTLDHRDPR